MNNTELLMKKIQNSYIININEGKDPTKTRERLMGQICAFLNREPNLRSTDISRGMRDFVTEQNRSNVIAGLASIYFEYIESSKDFNSDFDRYIKGMINKRTTSQLIDIILRNKNLLNRMGNVSVNLSIDSLVRNQNKDKDYMKKAAMKSTPQNNALTMEMLSRAKSMIEGIKDNSKRFGYNNVFNGVAIRNDIRREVKLKAKNGLYSENGMTGILNIGTENGKEKTTQEDSILIMTHPENPKFRLALVADGMGGQGNGDAASYIAVSQTIDWFKNLPKQFFNSDLIKIRYQNGKTIELTFEDMVKEHLLTINDKIVENLGRSPGTTFSAAITRNKNGRDIISSISVGDSKILKIGQDGKVTQLSKDDSILSDGISEGSLYVDENDPNSIYTTNLRNRKKDVTYMPIKNANRPSKIKPEDVRFYRKNNIITNCLGVGKSREKLMEDLDDSSIITDWHFGKGDKIFLCSDGIADTLSNPEIRDLVYTFRNPQECLKNMINAIYNREQQKIKYATNNPPQYLQNNNNFKSTLKGSQDNMSGIIIENKGDER